jgi:hypothetical protein
MARLVSAEGPPVARTSRTDASSIPTKTVHQPEGDQTMYPSARTRELAVLLRISRELDVCGDLTATVDNPSELIAWASVLASPSVLAWRTQDSGCRYVQVAADHRRAPIRGRVTAVLACEQHPEFWDALPLEGLQPGRTRALSVGDLAEAWKTMPITPPDVRTTPEPPSPATTGAPSSPSTASARPTEQGGDARSPQGHRHGRPQETTADSDAGRPRSQDPQPATT